MSPRCLSVMLPTFAVSDSSIVEAAFLIPVFVVDCSFADSETV